MKYKGLTIKYALINAFFFMLVCGTAGYTNNYLLYRGFSSSTIGIILTGGSILTLAFQTGMAPVIDNSKKLDEKKFILICLAVACAAYVLEFLIPGDSPAIIPMVVCGVSFAAIGMPFLNSIAFLYEKEGQTINYGVCRGVGSLAYALGGQIIGRLLAAYTEKVMPLYLLVMALLTIVSVIMLKVPERTEDEKPAEKKEEEAQISYPEFFRKYNKLILPIFALILLFFAHMLINNYMINVLTEIGGTTADQGNVIFLQAVVELPPMFLFAIVMKKISVNKLMVIGSVVYVVKHFLMLVATSMAVFYVACVLQMLSYALITPAMVYFAAENVGPEDRNKGQAIIMATSTVGGLFASFLGGFMLSALGVHSTLLIGTIATAAGAVLMFLGIKALEKK